MPTGSTNQYTTGFTIKIEGTPLSPEAISKITEWRVDDHLKLPDSFSITIYEPDPARMTLIDDKATFAVGKSVRIEVSAVTPSGEPASPTSRLLIEGLIASVEPVFSKDTGATMVVRGYDKSHTMNGEKRAQTFQKMTVGDIVKKVASGAGVAATVDSGVPSQQLEFTQQNNESDWEFIGRVAQRVGARAMVSGSTLTLAPMDASDPGPVLEWGKNLLSFRPRITGVQQAKEVVVRGWDVTAKKAIEATAGPGTLMAQIGESRDDVVKGLKGGRHVVADRPVVTHAEAQDLAEAVMSRIANGYVEGDGVCLGNPEVKAGCKVEIKGVGARFSGKYTLSSTRHVYTARGYETRFTISGGSERSLVDLLTPARTKRWGNSVVLGIVTNNDDPEKRGRVRVKFPALADTEGNWARVCQVAAGNGKGLMWIPAVNDEVVVGFEHDDVNHPYVLGAVFNGKDKPDQNYAHQAIDLVQGGDDAAVAKDSSVSLKSPKHVGIETKEKMGVWVGEELQIKVGECTVTCKKDGTVEIKGKNITLDATQNLTLKAAQNVKVDATQSLTMSAKQGATVDGGASTTVKASGTVSVSGAQVSLG